MSLESLVGSLTLGDLAARSGKTVEQIVGFAFAEGQPARHASSSPSKSASAERIVVRGRRGRGRPKKHRAAKGGAVDVRTAAGRAAYREAILEALRDHEEPAGAQVLIEVVGGEPGQLRGALHGLIEEGRVISEGVARWTKYSLA